MSSIIESEKRDVFPIWRKYEDALKIGELDPFLSKKSSDFFTKTKTEFDFYTIENWKGKNTIVKAADILNYAVMHNNVDANISIEAAKFIIQNEISAGKNLIDLAKHILKENGDGFNELIITPNTTYHINDLIYSEISKLKRMVGREPKFGVGWIELARSYVVLNQIEKAKRCILTALFVAPSDRFVLRSAARFFIHLNEYDRAHYILIKSPFASSDPWILSSILSLNRKTNKKSNHFSKGKKILTDNKYSDFSTTELASAMGTIELYNGSVKQAKRLFKKSLAKPSDNSLAQVSWYSNLGDLEGGNYPNLDYAYEADTVRSYRNGEIEYSYEQNLKWIMEEPFSIRPILTASYNTSTFLENYKETINIVKLGLKTNPSNSRLKNNLIYGLIMDGQLNEASEIFKTISAENDNKFTLNATKGLLEFRSGRIEKGRELYNETIDSFKKKNLAYLEALAYVNYAREEVIAKTDIVPMVMSKLKSICEKRPERDIQFLYNKNVELFEKTKTNL